MAIILHINTAGETAFVILSNDDKILSEVQSDFQKSHASFLEPAIEKACSAVNVEVSSLDAVSVVNGPGSYTGLRVGLSSAKALCYALKKPLLLLNTLDVMAHALERQSPVKENVLFCPLIDARRMEVYTALYDSNIKLIKSYSAEILDVHFLENERKIKTIVTGGNGSFKLKKLFNYIDFIDVNPLLLSQPTVILANQAFKSKNFSDIAYNEPFYLKPVYFKN